MRIYYFFRAVSGDKTDRYSGIYRHNGDMDTMFPDLIKFIKESYNDSGTPFIESISFVGAK